jgi:hypothetical protein
MATALTTKLRENMFVAIKALNGSYTSLHQEGFAQEEETLNIMSQLQPSSPHVLTPRLQSPVKTKMASTCALLPNY